MNAKETINKIVNILGLKFKSEKFYSTMLVDGETEVTNNVEGPFEVGQAIYVVGESTLSPAPEGEHETRDGFIMVLDENSVIVEIREKEAVQEEVEEVVEEEVEVEASEELDFATQIATLSQEISLIKESLSEVLSLIGGIDDTFNSDINKLKDDFETFKKQPQHEPKESKVNVKDKFNSYRLDILKELRNK